MSGDSGTGGAPGGGAPGGGAPGGGSKRGLFDDLAGIAGGAFSVLSGARAEAEAMGRAQMDALIQRLDLVKREDLDAALEVARRAREHAEALELRIIALEAKQSPAPVPMTESPVAPAADPGLTSDGG